VGEATTFQYIFDILDFYFIRYFFKQHGFFTVLFFLFSIWRIDDPIIRRMANVLETDEVVE
jgi:hypothetical protein